VAVGWQQYSWLPDVSLAKPDSLTTSVVLNSDRPVQVARSNSVKDLDGERQPTVLFPAGTEAVLVWPDGSTKPVASLTVRATEYTVGKNGPTSMPATLPSTSAYTYAVELTADEAAASGASDVKFNRPVFHYVEN